MILVLHAHITPDGRAVLVHRLESHGVHVHVSEGATHTVLGLVGDPAAVDALPVAVWPEVAAVHRITTPWRRAARSFVAERTVVRVGQHLGAHPMRVGDGSCQVIAGPCAVEGRAMVFETAHRVRAAGAHALRGGAVKPRTSPYAFQGMGDAALEILAEVRVATGLPIVTEVTDPRAVEAMAQQVDLLQIGARNMQNYALLAEVGQQRTPVLLKRGLAATLAELILAAEHIMARGNMAVILCERGIRTFETMTRNTLDVAAVPVLQRETHCPVIVDPSHAAGTAGLVAPLALAAVAAGADGLLIEVHPSPATARSDGEQSLSFAAFDALMLQVAAVAAAIGRVGPVRPTAGADPLAPMAASASASTAGAAAGAAGDALGGVAPHPGGQPLVAR